MVNVADHIEGAVAMTFGPGLTALSGAGNVAGTTVLAVTAGQGTNFAAGQLALVQDGTSSEFVRVAAVAANSVTITPGLAAGHAAAVPLVQAKVATGGFGPRSPWLSGG